MENDGFEERQEAVASNRIGEEQEGDGGSPNPKPPVYRILQCPFEFPPWQLRLHVYWDSPTGRESVKAWGHCFCGSKEMTG